jgi:class 3 adenylate cyclase
MNTRTVVELDLVGYSDLSRMLEENVGVQIVARLNDQIQGFVDTAVTAVGAERKQVVFATTGDGAILAFDDPAVAHNFAAEVHKAAQTHNAKRSVDSAQRWFRIGIATGELYQQPRSGGGQEIAGTVIATAVRLEAAARPGQILADAVSFASLPSDLQKLYGPEETVPGKRSEQFAARRCTVIPYAASEDSPASVQSVLDLFDRLTPRDQLGRLMLRIGMPEQFRPSDTLSLFHRQDAIVNWAASKGAAGLAELSAALKDLIRRQQFPLH